MLSGGRRLTIASWNIAAINNNPFEYWITYKENPAYEDLMIQVEKFLDAPGDRDVKVNQVFTEDMFTKLDSRLTGVGWKSVRPYWEADFQDRRIVSGFMKVGACFHGWTDFGFLFLACLCACSNKLLVCFHVCCFRISCWEASVSLPCLIVLRIPSMWRAVRVKSTDRLSSICMLAICRLWTSGGVPGRSSCLTTNYASKEKRE